MRKKIVLFTGVLGMVLALSYSLQHQMVTDAQECRIVRIQQELGGSGKVIRLEPDTMLISKGTCVIWINWVPAQEVRVIFKDDGKRCQDATEAPMGFKMAENCFVTNFVPLGATSSLRFNDAGTYTYEVEVPGEKSASGPLGLAHGEVRGTGQIIVE